MNKEVKKMKTNKFNMFSGLGKTLGLSFVLFALIPIALVSVVYYKQAHDSLKVEILNGLDKKSDVAYSKLEVAENAYDALDSKLKEKYSKTFI